MQAKGLGLRVWVVVKRIVFWLFIFQLIYIVYGKWCNPPITFTQAGAAINGQGLKRSYVPLQQISTNLQLAIIASEDQSFLDHEGIDFEEIKRAYEYNKTHKNKIGGSTISQQTAKNFFLWQGKSYLRKGLEAYFTKMIEWTWGKRRILEVYLNIIEMGPGIFGAEAAAQHYFKKRAKDLTLDESAYIAAILPNPIAYTAKPNHPKVLLRKPRIKKLIEGLRQDDEIMSWIKQK
jgi:monofunctional glycosyltransferase